MTISRSGVLVLRAPDMGEDKSLIRTRNAPHVMVSVRNLALHRLAGTRGIAEAMRTAGRNSGASPDFKIDLHVSSLYGAIESRSFRKTIGIVASDNS